MKPIIHPPKETPMTDKTSYNNPFNWRRFRMKSLFTIKTLNNHIVTPPPPTLWQSLANLCNYKTLFLLILSLAFSLPVNAQEADPTDLCSRTTIVKNVIVGEVSGKTNCADITTAELAGITQLLFFGSLSSTSLKGSNLKSGDFAGLTGLTTLNLSGNEITTLPADIFSGLSALESLSLGINQLTTLPSGIFSGLRSLTSLNLLNNPLPTSLPASLFADVPSTATIILPTGTTINAAVPMTVGSIPAQTTNLGIPLTVNVANKFSDTGDTLTYTVESNNTATATVEVSGSTVTITPVAIGTATITITAADTAGQTVTQTFMVSVNAQGTNLTDLCSRTAVVKNVIVDEVSGKTNCADITTAELAGITQLLFFGSLSSTSLKGSNLKSGDFAGLTGLTTLNLSGNEITTLPADIFSGLSALESLSLGINQLTTLPSGIFSGLRSLTSLNLLNNPLPTSLPASLFADVPSTATIILPTGTTINAAVPMTVGSIPAQTTNLGIPLTVNVANKFSDTGDTLTYTVESNNTATATVEVSGSTVTITPVAIGTATITITAADTAGQTVTQTFMVSVNAQGTNLTDLCSRTAVVKNVIVDEVSGKTNCADITTAELAGITQLLFFGSLSSTSLKGSNLKSGDFAGLTGLTTLNLSGNEITTLPADIFSGLSALESLSLGINQLTTLPSGIFSGLRSLTSLNLLNNPLPTSLPASLFADVPSTATIILPTGTTINAAVPMTVGSIPAQTTNLGIPLTVNVANKFSDTGDTLTYTVESNNTATATVEVSGSTITITPVAAGSATITITATDTADQTVTQTFMVSVNAQEADPTDLCSRTAVVKNVIVSKVSGKTNCADITVAELAGVTGLSFVGGSLNGSSLRGSNLKSGDFAGLTGLTDLRLRFNEITTLPADIFSGLSALTRLELDNNQLSTLPTGVFSGLISLTTLNLSSNSLPTSLPASLFADLPATATITFPTGTTINAAVPTTVGTIANITDLVENGSPQTVDVANKFSDTGDTLTYTVESNNTATATVAVSGSTITITPVAIGTATITITATDTADQTVTQTFMVSVNAQEADPTDLCSRTAVVKNVIVSKVSGKTNCADITVAELAGVTGLSFVGGSLNGSSLRGSNLKSGDFAGLTGLTDLRLRFNEITTLPADIFSGLSALTRLELDNNQLSTLPTGVFSGLISLTNLNLSNNPLPASLPASLFADLPATATITLPTGTTINDIPTTVGTIANITDLVENGSPQTVDVANKFSDTGDTLTYTVESNNTATATVAVSGSTITITPVAIGTATITITATDTADQTVTQTFMVSVNAQEADPTDLCSRTAVVKNVIVSKVSGKTNCADITVAELAGVTGLSFVGGSLNGSSLRGSNLKSGDFAGLTGLTDLRLRFNEITTLPADIFSGLSALTRLELDNNQLSTLPTGVFSGLISLTNLNLSNNPLPASLPASLFADVPRNAITLPAGTTVDYIPTTVGTIADIDLVENGSPQTVDVANKFSDTGDTLTYTVESNNTATATVAVSGSTVTITPVAAGSATITITAADTAGQTAIQTFVVSVNAQEADPTDLCSRSQGVRDEIVASVSGKTNCADITTSDLAGITTLQFAYFSLSGGRVRDNLKSGDFAGLTGLEDITLKEHQLTTLPADIFSGLSALTTLRLDNNQLSTLPSGIFAGLTSLTTLNLSGNSLPTSLPASLFSDVPSTATITLPTGTTINAAVPTTVGTIANITNLVANGSPQTVDVANKFSDPNDTLTYTVESNNTATATVAVSGSAITITPVAIGTADITITATDTAGQTATQTFVVTVVDTTPVAVPSISISPATVAATVGTAIANITIDSSGGAVDSYSISPTLTAGLTLDTATGTISGTPTATAPSRTYTITATNSAGTATAMVNITVNAAPVVNNPAPTIAAVLVNIDLAVDAQPHTLNVANKFSDPDDTLTFSVQSDNTATASVAVSGSTVTITPIAIGTTTITVTAADTIGQTVTQTFMVTVISSPLPNPPVCMRHPKVKEVIIDKVSGKSACGDITAADLAAITSLVLRGGFRSGLGEAPPKRSDFAGLTTLGQLDISDNSNLGGLTTLPADLFQGLPALRSLRLTNNQLRTLPIGIFQGLFLSDITLSGNPWVSFPTNIFEELVGDSQHTRNLIMGLAPINAALPVANGDIPAQSLALTADPITLEVATFFSDPDDTLTYTATSAAPAIASVAISGSTLTITPVALGTTNIMVTARDTAGQPVTQTFALTVSGDAAAVAAPDITPSVTELIATQAVAITPITIDAEAGGAVDSYSISPDLPAGLSIDPTTGEISGTPTAVAGEQIYTITATNTTGTDTASVTITVNTVAPRISISPATLVANMGSPIMPITITPTGGGAVVSYSIAPDIQNGLLFDTTDGTISGTPTAVAEAITYTITATNSGGSDTATVTITVEAPDTTPPSVTISSLPESANIVDGDTVNATTLRYEVTFSELISGFEIDDITVTGTAAVAASGLTGGANGTGLFFQFEVLKGNLDGTVIVSIAENIAEDTAGNGNTASGDYTLTIDTTSPVITLTGDAALTIVRGTDYTDAGATANDNIGGDITGSITRSFTLDGTEATTLNTAQLGTYIITYDVSDAANNPAMAVTRTVTTVEALSPNTNGVIATAAGDKIRLQFVDQQLTNNDAAPGDFILSGAAGITVTELAVDAEDSTVLILTLSGNIAKDAAVTLAYTRTAGSISGVFSTDSISSNGIVIDFTATAVDTSNIVAPDQTEPTIQIASTATSPTNANPIPINLTFSESLTGFEESNITVSGGTITADSYLVTSSNPDGSSLGASFTITPSNDGLITVRIAAGAAQNLATNGNPAASFDITYDGTAPVVTITSDSGNNGDTVEAATLSYTATFSEDVTGFEVGGITVTGTAGVTSATNFMAVSTTVYTFDVLRGDPDGTVIVSIAKDSAMDSAGNGNTASGGFGLTIRTPLTITSMAQTVNVNSFTLTGTARPGSDLTVSHRVGTSSAPETTLTTTTTNWEVEVTLLEGDNRFEVARNLNKDDTTYSNSVDITLDSTAPAVAITTTAQAVNDAAFRLTGTVEAGATVDVLKDGTSIGAASVTDTTWMLDVTLTEGANLFTVTASDTAMNTSTPTAAVSITLDTTTAPSISITPATVTATAGTAITPITITSSGGDVASYGIAPDIGNGLLFDANTGTISGTPTATAEAITYTITATNSGGTATATVAITVNAAAVAVPIISISATTVTATVGSAIADITIDSTTGGGGAVASYSINPDIGNGLLFDANTGTISGTPTATAEAISYTITATNSGGTATATVAITVNAAAVAVPIISISATTVTATVGTAIADITIDSTTGGGGAVASYGIDPNLPAGLLFDANTGTISGTPTAVAEAISYIITATNSGGTDTATVAITVNAAAVAAPIISISATTVTVTVGSAIADITIDSTTGGGGAVASYGIAPDIGNGLLFDANTGTISGTPTATAEAITYTITATNSGGTATATVAITVNAAAVAVPIISISATTVTATVGSAIADITIDSTTGGGGAVASYSINPDIGNGLLFDANTGTISGTPTAVSASTNYTITATNSSGLDTVTLTIVVNAAPVAVPSISISTATVTATVGNAIADITITSSGGAVASYGIAPTLPEGLTLDPTTGTISGTPTAVSASTNYTITATNSSGLDTVTLTIVVNAAAVAVPSISISSATVTATVGSAIADITIISSGGTVSSYGIAPTLPDGLTLDTSNGTISGTPTAVSASTNYTITATNSSGLDTVTLTIVVNAAPGTTAAAKPVINVPVSGTEVNTNFVMLTGTASPGANVLPSLIVTPEGPSSRGTAYPNLITTAGSDGVWTIRFYLDIGFGEYTIVVTATAGSGDSTILKSSEPITITRVRDTSHGATITTAAQTVNTASFTLTGTANGPSFVQLFRGAATTAIGNDNVLTAGGAWTITVMLEEGANVFTATATDGSGKSAASAAVIITLNTANANTPPTADASEDTSGSITGASSEASPPQNTPNKSASLLKVFNGSQYVDFVGGVTIQTGVPKFKGTSSGISSVQVLLNDVQVGGNNISSDGTFRKGWKHTPLADGTYTISINNNKGGRELFSSSIIIDKDSDGNPSVSATINKVDAALSPFDLTVMMGKTAAIGDELSVKDISISPNPTSGILNITVNEKADYRLLNIRGQTLKTGVLFTGKSKIDISSFAKGIYLLNIKTSKESFTRKVIKN